MLRQLVFLWLTLLTINLYSQDEGLIERRTRFEHPHSIGFQIGPLFRLGKADYSGGYEVTIGYSNRINRILTIGPKLSFAKFRFQPSLTNSYSDSDVKGNNVFQSDTSFYEIYVVSFRGGNLTQLSLGLNLKLDFKPYTSGQRIRYYIIAEPFILVSQRSSLSSISRIWYFSQSPSEDSSLWSGGDIEVEEGPNTPGRQKWTSSNELTGGAQLGMGFELELPGNWSVLLQPTLRYTLPITHIKTSSYPRESLKYSNTNFPMVKESFSTVGILVGLSHHF